LPIPLFNQRPLILQLAQLQHLRRQRSQPYPVGLRFTFGTIDRRLRIAFRLGNFFCRFGLRRSQLIPRPLRFLDRSGLRRN